MTDYIQVMTTFATREAAEKMAGHILEARLAACVQIIGPMTSHYHWQGGLERTEEYLCLMKSRQDLYVELEANILARHPYEVPEILAVPVLHGGASYLNWLAAELKA